MSETPFNQVGPFAPQEKEMPVQPSHVVPVSGETVHARGGVLVDLNEERLKRLGQAEIQKADTVQGSAASELLLAVQSLRKGDVFTNPETGARQIIEGIRKEGNTQVVLFTNELEPGVRAEPGEAIRQLPFENFEVQRKAGGFMEWKPVYEQEFDEIFDDCQQIFEDMAEVLEQESQANQEFSHEAIAQAEKVGNLSLEVGAIEDAWVIAGTIDDQRMVTKKKLELLSYLKEVVVELPEPWVQPYPRLKKIQDELQLAHKKGEVESIEVDEDGDQKKSKGKSGRGKQLKDSDRQAHTSRATGKGRVRDVAGLETMVSGERMADKTRREARRGEANQSAIDFHAYRKSAEELEADWSDESIPLAAWIDTIRKQQADLVVVVDELERLGGVGRWEEALQSLGAGYQQLTLFADRESVAQYLNDLDTIFIKKRGRMAETEKATRTQRFAEERPKLREILFKYYDILRIGEAVINELRQAASQRGETKEEEAALPRRNERREASHPRREQSQERMPSHNKIQSMLFEARVLLADWSELRQSVDPKKRTAFDQAVKKRLGITRLPQFDFQVRWIETQSERDDWRTPEGREMLAKLDDQLRKYGLIVAACRREVGKFRKKSKKPGRPTATVGSRSLIVDQASKSMGEVWENTNSKVKEELLTGLQALETQKNEDAEAAFEILKDSGVPPEDQGAIVIQTLAPAFNEAVSKVLGHVNIQLPPAEMAEFTQGLLSVNPTEENDDVGK